MYRIQGKRAVKVEETTFSALGLQENDLEELLRNNIDLLCSEEESMLIVGRQVKNEKLGRSDLTAVDNNGSIVLIEIKRDVKDIENRREAFEFQAVRYTASYATIKSPEELGLYIDTFDKERNERYFDCLSQEKEMVEQEIGDELSWEKVENARYNCIVLYTNGSIEAGESELAGLKSWGVEKMIKFHKVFTPRIKALGE